ncbi:MAG: GNAT family N-acetyltransferase [Phycisphaerales bacterium]
MNIRPLIPADADAYTVLRREMLRDSPWAYAASESNDRGLDADGLRHSLAAPNYAIIGAFDARPDAPVFNPAALGPPSSRLVGSVGLMRTPHDKMAHRADIWGVYVTPTARGKGLCLAMLDAAFDLARSWRGVDSVGLSVSVRSAAARRAYVRAGFVAWGLEPRALAWSGEQIDEIHMLKML